MQRRTSVPAQPGVRVWRPRAAVNCTWFYFAAFDPRLGLLSITDDLGNLVPVPLGQCAVSTAN